MKFLSFDTPQHYPTLSPPARGWLSIALVYDAVADSIACANYY
jgi:hypothetical protein